MIKTTQWCAIAMAALGIAATVFGQSPEGKLQGVVKDASGGSVADVKITLSDSKNNAKSAISDASGGYSFTGLTPGVYSLQAEAPGFQNFEQKTITVTGDRATTLDIPLALSKTTGQVDVTAKIDPFDIIPDRPTNSLFGIDKPLVEIPRSISVVESETMTRYDIRTVNDLVTVSPGSFTGSYFGVPGSLFVRGEAGDNFFRGFRRVENRGNYATPVAATDHIEIVKGPPSPIYGGGKVGGFLNFIPKSARSTTAKWLEHPTGKVTLTYGSYDQKIGTIEFGSPFKIGGYRAGFYSFFDVQDSKSFYRNISTREKLGQIAFDSELPKNWRTEFGMQGFAGSLPQNIGWNRVTQDLVDNHNYLAGLPKVNLNTNGYNLGPQNLTPGELLQFAFTSNFAPILRDPANAKQASEFALDPATIHTVKLSPRTIMVDTPDFSDAVTYTGYFDLIRDFRPGVSFKNQTFYDQLDHQKYSSYGFSANYTPNVIENKTTMDYEWKPTKWIAAQMTGGFAYRYSSVTAGESRTLYQVIDRTDLSVGVTPNTRFQGAFNSNGGFGYNYLQKGNYGDTGLFFLSDVTLASKLSVLTGVRYDHYNPDFTGRDNNEALTRAKDSSGAVTYNTSVSYKLPFHIVPYFTYATSTFLDLGQGGELDYAQILNHTFLQNSNLYEGGLKLAAMDNKLFASLSIFRQRRSSFNSQSGAIDYFVTKGTELEVRAAVNRHLSLTGAVTWQNPQQLNVPFLLGIPGTVLGLTPQETYAGRFFGDASIFNIKAPVRVAGQPPVVASVFGTYSPKRNYGFTLGTTWVEKIKAGYVTDVTLPSYWVWRGSAYYEFKQYSANLAVSNLFNKEYFTSQYLFWDVFIKPSQQRTLSLTVSYRF